jgi:hypothetical protein
VVLTGGGEPDNSDPPDLQLSGPKKQNPQADEVNDRGGRNVHLRVSCGDEACTARATGKLTNVKKGACGRSAHRSPCRKLSPNGPKVVPPGETRALGPELTKDSQCREVRKALADGKNVQAKITVRAKDAAGNVATAKRTIKLVK